MIEFMNTIMIAIKNQDIDNLFNNLYVIRVIDSRLAMFDARFQNKSDLGFIVVLIFIFVSPLQS